ncbi:MAG: DUF4271 domain-containing protein [Bacteroidales bacterium]|nr:DUF4271 domain-containing protein [Bacteroidales bacterium]
MNSFLAAIPSSIDEAFKTGELLLPTESADVSSSIISRQWDEYTLLCIIGFVALVISITALQRIVNLIPSLVGCVWSGKECVNLENSAKLSGDRDQITFVLIIPFCLLASFYGLWGPRFIGLFNPTVCFLITCAVALLYVGMKVLLSFMLQPRSLRPKDYQAVNHCFRTFFIILTIIALATAGVMALLGSEKSDVKNVILWECAVVYVLYLLRKTQIFASSGNLFSTFLYLCALEFLPTGLLVASAMIF